MSEIVFQWPAMLLLLVAIPPIGWVMLWAREQRRKTRAALGQARSREPAWKDCLWITVLVLIVVCLARPGYDPVRRSISSSGRDVVFILDVSRSMLAQDAYPSRLEAAKQGIRDCLDGFQGEQVGLVIYGGSSSISCPLTADYEFVRYMLSQVQPRSVEFGGTMLLSAIEKTLDQVLDPDRRGFHDLVVLTDGEDHGPGMERVAKAVEGGGANLLIVGLGDSVSGSRIPILNDEGETISLKHEGSVVYTKLQDKALSELVDMYPNGEYHKAGTLPFHLGDLYRSFAQGKESIGSDSEAGYVVYSEGAFILMPFALILGLLASGNIGERFFVNAAIVFLVTVLAGEKSSAQEELVSDENELVSFEEAVAWLGDQRYQDAAQAFGEQAIDMERRGASSMDLAAAIFNQGLGYHLHAESLRALAPREALDAAVQAREAFLLAARERPAFRRASVRLDTVAVLVEELTVLVEEQERREQEQEAEIEALLERIQKLLDDQLALKGDVEEADEERRPSRRLGQGQVSPSPSIPSNADTLSSQFANGQIQLSKEGKAIREEMRGLDQKFSAVGEGNTAQALDQMETIMKRPLELMDEAIDAQEDAAELLRQWHYWPSARVRQTVAADRLQEILDLFASSSEDEGEADWEDEDWDEYSESEDGESIPSSMQMEGEFRKDSMMQPLPTPNFSPEEVLMEEMGNQQFREEQRAKANAGKVGKDW